MRIGLCGASCCGKSTLVEAIHQKYPMLTIIREIAGTFTEEERNDYSFQQLIIEKQICYEKDLQAGFISDRTVMDNLAYLLWYYKGHDFKTSDIFMACMKIFDTHMKSKPYDMVFFIDEYFVLENNGIRCMDHKQQSDTFEMLLNIANLYGKLYGIPIVFIKGTTEERISQIEKHATLG